VRHRNSGVCQGQGPTHPPLPMCGGLNKIGEEFDVSSVLSIFPKIFYNAHEMIINVKLLIRTTIVD